ncbi:MAG: hypothetical protein ACFFDF_01880 [Candidatus Odinarchaeota archaeon]
MSSGKGLGIIALLIGISGLGLGVYSLVVPQVHTNFGIQNTWFNYDSTTYPTNPIATDIILDALTINFTVNTGESVYFLFNTYAIVMGGSPPVILFNFFLDGVKKVPPTYPEVVFGSDGPSQYGSVTLQISKVISIGFHNLTIVIASSYASNGIKDSTLLVQTFIP